MAEIKEKMTIEKPGFVRSEDELRRGKQEIIQDVRERHNVPKEIKTWMEKIEQDPQAQQSVHDDSGQPILTPSAPANPKIQLPGTRNTFLAGLKKPFDEAGRWFSAFVLRLIKKSEGNVKFREE